MKNNLLINEMPNNSINILTDSLNILTKIQNPKKNNDITNLKHLTLTEILSQIGIEENKIEKQATNDQYIETI